MQEKRRKLLCHFTTQEFVKLTDNNGLACRQALEQEQMLFSVLRGLRPKHNLYKIRPLDFLRGGKWGKSKEIPLLYHRLQNLSSIFKQKQQKMAGAARLELATPGFGDQCSTN